MNCRSLARFEFRRAVCCTAMRRETLARYWLPNKNPRGKPYLSAWRMSPEDAKARGAIRPEPGTEMVIDVAETPEEEALLRRRTDTSKVSGRPG
jgi:hypothetical protein